MIKLTVYSAKGTKKPSITLPKQLEQEGNLALLAQAVRVYEDRSHFNVPRAKTRSEVKISKRKIYRQKGTGNARHGAASAPIFVGGGVAHGPKGIKRHLRLPKKMRKIALGVALSLKAKDSALIVVDGVDAVNKTKEAAELLAKIGEGEKNISKKSRITFVLSEKNKDKSKVFRNIKNLNVEYFDQMNAYTSLSGIVVVDSEALKKFSEKKAKTTKSVSDEKPSQKSLPKKAVKAASKKTVSKSAKKTKKKGK